ATLRAARESQTRALPPRITSACGSLRGREKPHKHCVCTIGSRRFSEASASLQHRVAPSSPSEGSALREDRGGHSEEVVCHPVPCRDSRLRGRGQRCIGVCRAPALRLVRDPPHRLLSEASDRGCARPWQGGSKGPPCHVSRAARGRVAFPP